MTLKTNLQRLSLHAPGKRFSYHFYCLLLSAHCKMCACVQSAVTVHTMESGRQGGKGGRREGERGRSGFETVGKRRGHAALVYRRLFCILLACLLKEGGGKGRGLFMLLCALLGCS